MNKQYLYAGAALCVFAAIAGCNKSASPTPDTVATVDGTPITGADFTKYLERMPTVKVRAQNGQVVDAHPASPVGFQAVQALIEQNLLLEIAKDEGVAPTDDQVEKEIAFQRDLSPSFVSNLQKEGLSMQDIRNSIRVDLARFNVMTRGITVSQTETADYIKQHAEQFSTPPSANLLWIVADDKHKKQADQELASGSPFSSVAVHYSQDPRVREFEGKYNNGQGPVTVVSQMPPALQQLVNSTAELKSTNWLKDRDKWIKFFVQSKTGAKSQVSEVEKNPAKMKQIQKLLMLQKAPQSDLAQKMMAKMRAAAVQINIEPYPEYWKLEQQDLAQQMAASQTGTAPAGAPTRAPATKPKR